MRNQVLLVLRKVTATRQLKADHPLTVQHTKPKNNKKYRVKAKNGLDKGRNSVHKEQMQH